MRILKTTFLIITFLSVSMVSIAQTTLGETIKNEVTSIDSLVKSNISAWTDAMAFFLTTDERKLSIKTSVKAYGNYLFNKLRHNESFKAFMCNKNDDDAYVRYSTGKKRNILPTITMTFTNVTSGKSFTIKKNIRSLNKFLRKTTYNIEHIDIENVQVYLVDDVKRKEGVDIARFVYYTEHIFATAEYKVSKDIYEKVNQQNDSFYINRGKSYGEPKRNEEALIKKEA